MLRNRYRALLQGGLTLPLFRARLVAHIGGAGEIIPGDLLGFLDVQEGFLQRLLVHGAWEVQPRYQRVAEFLIGQGAHFLLEPRYLSLPQARTQIVHHEGYELAFLRLAVRHLSLLERFRCPSLQRKVAAFRWSLSVRLSSSQALPRSFIFSTMFSISAIRASKSRSMSSL